MNLIMKSGVLTRETVLQQAETIVAQNGFSKLTYNGLARQCGVKPQSLYRYVDNIADVKSGVISLYIQQLTANIASQLTEDTGKTALLHGGVLFLTQTQMGISFADMVAGIVEFGENQQVRAALNDLRGMFGQYIEQVTTDPSQLEMNKRLYFEMCIGNIALFNTSTFPVDKGVQILRQNLKRVLELF
ncbi:TetR/AcrR family transcriptional regulator [Levilactobacillus brevis]|nr:TetR/AcrR family transcriptional regulator [Levilactobacillus brevis]